MMRRYAAFNAAGLQWPARRHIIFGFALIIPVFCGCMTYGLYETARCSPQGQIEHSLSYETEFTLDKSGSWSTPQDLLETTWGGPQYTLRLGIFRNCELAARLGLGSAGLSAKYTFLDREPAMALAIDAAGSLFFIPLVPSSDFRTGTFLDGRLLVSDEPGPVGYAASLGVARRQEDFAYGLETGASRQSLDIVAGGGLPVMLGERIRLMPGLSVGVPVWSKLTESEWDPRGDSSYTLERPDVRRLSVSLGLSLSYVRPANDYEYRPYGW